ncbi:MAG: hypothetical protein ACT4PZ_17460 [Panacagrimonas sp.]
MNHSRPLVRLALFCALAVVPPVQAQDAASLEARHAALREPLKSSPFQRPLHLVSSEDSGDLAGGVYARMEQPFSVVGKALQSMEAWCDILILQFNVKACIPSSSKAGDVLRVIVGRKHDQPLEDAQRLEFLYKVVETTPDYLQVMLSADKGPLGTSRYRIVLEAVKLDAPRSFLHMSYSYTTGFAARLALRGYLATSGRNKVGFSVVGREDDGGPVYIGGERGVIERNTMRYYLAIETYLEALSVPAPQRLEKRLSDWHAKVELYPLQLSELERAEYLEIKRKEIERQQAPDIKAKEG